MTLYRALVEYRQPSHAELEQAFGHVSEASQYTEFKPIDVCKDVPTDTREIEFELIHLNKDASTDEALTELGKQGFRPALYEELLGFTKRYPDGHRDHLPIVALGSVFNNCGHPYLPQVRGDDRIRILDFRWIGRGWDVRHYFLVVRKQ